MKPAPGGGGSNVFQRIAAQFGDKFGSMACISRFVGLAALGHRCEEGRIGFHQYSIQRHVLGGFLNQRRIFEGNDAGKRNIETQIEREFGYRITR